MIIPRLVLTAALTTSAALAAPQTPVVVSDFGGLNPSGTPTSGGFTGSISVNSLGTAFADLDGDGIADTVSFAAEEHSLIGIADSSGSFQALGADPFTELAPFDVDGDGWLDTDEIRWSGLSFNGSAGVYSIVACVESVYLSPVAASTGETYLGGLLTTEELFGFTLATATSSWAGYAAPVPSGAAAIAVVADPREGDCTAIPDDTYYEGGQRCRNEDAKCVRDTRKGKCTSKAVSKVNGIDAYCLCSWTRRPPVGNSPVLSLPWATAISLLIVASATVMTFRRPAGTSA